MCRIIRFEMSLTLSELHRLSRFLPGADRVRLDLTSAWSEEADGRRWRIAMSNPRTRSFGNLSVAVADVEITLTGYDRPGAERFLEAFHLVFRKGGG